MNGIMQDLLRRSAAMLRAVQWSGREIGGCSSCGPAEVCPVCDAYAYSTGHDDDCNLQALLRDIDKELT